MPHILVVEDEEHLAIGIKYNLEAEGFSVTTAGNGQAALAAIAATDAREGGDLGVGGGLRLGVRRRCAPICARADVASAHDRFARQRMQLAAADGRNAQRLAVARDLERTVAKRVLDAFQRASRRRGQRRLQQSHMA